MSLAILLVATAAFRAPHAPALHARVAHARRPFADARVVKVGQPRAAAAVSMTFKTSDWLQAPKERIGFKAQLTKVLSISMGFAALLNLSFLGIAPPSTFGVAALLNSCASLWAGILGLPGLTVKSFFPFLGACKVAGVAGINGCFGDKLEKVANAALALMCLLGTYSHVMIPPSFLAASSTSLAAIFIYNGFFLK